MNVRKSRLLVDEFAFDLSKLKPKLSLPNFTERLEEFSIEKVGSPRILPKVKKSRDDVLALTNRIE